MIASPFGNQAGDQDARVPVVIDLMKRHVPAIGKPARIALGQFPVPQQPGGARLEVHQIQVDAAGTGPLGNQQLAIGVPVWMLQVTGVSSHKRCCKKQYDRCEKHGSHLSKHPDWPTRER